MDPKCSVIDHEAEAGPDAPIPRCTAAYVNQDEPFRVTDRSYEKQYAQLYFARLSMMAKVMQAQVAKNWPGIELLKILEVGSREGSQALAVIGTLYKNQKMKPSILDEYSKDRGLRAALGASSFCSQDDSLVLEDEGARMALQGDCLPVHSLVTGVVVAVRGVYELGGDFAVQDVLYAEMAPQVPRPLMQADKYVALVSGLKLSSSNTNKLLIHLAVDMLTGMLEEEVGLAAQVVRLVVAGGSVGSLDTIAQANQYSKHQLALQPIKELDAYCAELGCALPLDIMPGAEDPTNVALPQQPLHRCLLPGSSRCPELVRATNPHAFQLDGVRLLGTSGQPVDDMVKYSQQPDRLAVLEWSLRWRHLAPTAPDTLTTYPFHDRDPFILDATPHVLFAGNQPEFATRMATGAGGQAVRLIAVPSFHRTGCLVLLNLRSLECRPVCFGCSLGDGQPATPTPPAVAASGQDAAAVMAQ
ncbi:DNA polymerase alpha/epsilon subunit B-domain-containing protein [Haematococcus lacustris]